MEIKIGFVYKNQDGEYFKAEEKGGKIVLSNPSYPFSFLPETQQPLEEMGSVEEFGNLVEKKDYEFHEGKELDVKVKENGDLEVI